MSVCVSVLPSGPFPSSDMKEWFDEGYFTLDLMVRRACDDLMLPLGEPCTVCGHALCTVVCGVHVSLCALVCVDVHWNVTNSLYLLA